MTKRMTPGERVQSEMETFRGPQKEPPRRVISKPQISKPKPTFKKTRGR